MYKKLLPALLILLFVPQIGNAQFGTAVGIIGDEVVVMKPGGAFGGLGVVSVFNKTAGASWQLSERLVTEDAQNSGRPLSPSFGIAGSTLLLGGADPLGKLGGYLFAKNDGAWQETGKVFIDNSSDEALSEKMEVSDFMRYVSPPARKIAVDNSNMVIGVTRAPWSRVGVYVFEQREGDWHKLMRITDPTENRNGQFGAAVALQDDLLVVGAPGIETGRVFIYHRDSNNAWVLGDTLKIEGLDKSARFGSNVIVSGTRVLVASPNEKEGKGAVFVLDKDDAGDGWSTSDRIDLPGEGKGAFGSSIALVDNTLWVGAPGDMSGRGNVYLFHANTTSGQYENAGAVDSAQLTEGAMFGTSLAVSDQHAVIGSPGADGGRGMAIVFQRESDGEWEPTGKLRSAEILEAIAGEEITCEEGKAGPYDCKGVDLLSFLPMDGFGGASHERVSDVWGWTDPLTKKEYALIGRTGGAAIIDVSDPVLPVYMGLVPANPTSTRDLKVYQDHMFFTGDGAGDHGLVIFDLKRLRDPAEIPSTFAADTVYTGIASAHNLIIDEDSGFAYPVGASRGGETCGGGLHMVDIRVPLEPRFAGCYTDTIGLFSDGRTHDGQCVAYIGPDDRYAGRQVCFVSNETALRIVDVTDKANPEPLAAAKYPRVAYVHQGWLTDDQRYYYLNDELDELVGMTKRTRTMVWDIAELDDPVLVGEFEGSSTATDHNLYIKGDRMYQANYQAGLSIWDISNPEKPFEIGHFDTTPDVANPPGFVGAWTAYPYFESGTIIVSSMNEGLFMVRPSQLQMP